ncbi:acetyltransferase [Gottschalkia purinilytica]|uniref:Acetyltransferase n=1 Tax=Gottschalkia purinilytica TaxID=1503 RepID=A0A0L0W7G0_GOTPU|nr:GNAT family protein [Gottschalkia purinilytica]KNF07245.1 acetyltransferase [Gottschalkia purinilytica]
MIKLQYLEEKDFRKIVEWNGNKTSDYLLQWAGPVYTYPLTEDQIREYFYNKVKKENSDIFVYKIILADTNETIGTVELCIEDKVNMVGKIGRFLIGEENVRGRGIGKLVLEELLRIGFTKFKLEKIILKVFDFNSGAIKCYEGVGFVKENLIKNARKVENGYWNLYEMSISKYNWKNRNK